MDGNFDLLMLSQAYTYAAGSSTDPSSQNGAVIVDSDGKLLSKGANHFPRDVKELPERWERPLKYQFVEHSERNAIYTAARLGHKTQGCTMYVNWYACADCARAIIQAGIVEVVGHQDMADGTPDHWKESVRIGLLMLEEAGVKCRYVKGKIFKGEVFSIRFNGGLFYP